MFLFIGLGNTGNQYQNTRHNVGFFIVDQLRFELDLPEFNFEKKFNAEISKNENIILAKPQTFMNNSGEAVSKIINFYKIDSQDLWVYHDDLDLPLGEYRIQNNRGSAGHNGVKSIIDQLNTQTFNRVRIGIGTENLNTIPAENFVLQNFSPSEKKILNETIKKALVEILPMLTIT